jgi:hypothetical protein
LKNKKENKKDIGNKRKNRRKKIKERVFNFETLSITSTFLKCLPLSSAFFHNTMCPRQQ